MAYKSHALKLGSTWIGGVISQQFTNAPKIDSAPTAGSPYAQKMSIQDIKTGFRFQSYNVATALGSLGLLGLALGGGTSAEVYEILWNDNGSIAAGSVHRKIVFANGRVIWRSIRCSNQGDAVIDIEGFGLSSDGATSPVAYTESIALPTAVDDARHTLYTAKLADVSLGCITDLQIDSGYTIAAAACASQVFNTRLSVGAFVPKIRVTTLASQLVGSGSGKINLEGAAATHANTLIQLRKRTPKTGTFVAALTEEHISITADGLVVPIDPFSGSNNDDATTSFELTADFDGTNLPFVFDTTAALV